MSLKNCYNFEDFRNLAKKKLPSPIFHYIDGGSDDETTLRRNTESFNQCDLIPNVLANVGNPDLSKPQGKLIAGNPAKLAGIVSKSDKYIAIGLSTFSPDPKAVVGEVGANKISTLLNAFSKSLRIKVRTC